MIGRRSLFLLGASGLFCLTRLSAAGDLVWKTTQIDRSARLEEKTVEAIFPFTNSGQTAVTILSVSTSCGCTAASPDKKTYLPGETGEIKTVFTIGGRSGLQEKTIVVESNDAPDTPTTLSLRVTIPEAYSLEPRLLVWVADAKARPSEKSAVLSASAALTLKVREVVSDDPAFKARLVTEEKGKRFRIVITPTSLEKSAKGLVRVRLESSAGTELLAVIYTVIR